MQNERNRPHDRVRNHLPTIWLKWRILNPLVGSRCISYKMQVVNAWNDTLNMDGKWIHDYCMQFEGGAIEVKIKWWCERDF